MRATIGFGVSLCSRERCQVKGARASCSASAPVTKLS